MLTGVFLLEDRVFGPDCQTQRVYEEGAKDVALSALTGLNCKWVCHESFSSVQENQKMKYWYNQTDMSVTQFLRAGSVRCAKSRKGSSQQLS